MLDNRGFEKKCTIETHIDNEIFDKNFVFEAVITNSIIGRYNKSKSNRIHKYHK